MNVRTLHFVSGSTAVVRGVEAEPFEDGWVWIDVEAGSEDLGMLAAMAEELGLGALAVRDASPARGGRLRDLSLRTVSKVVLAG